MEKSSAKVLKSFDARKTEKMIKRFHEMKPLADAKAEYELEIIDALEEKLLGIQEGINYQQREVDNLKTILKKRTLEIEAYFESQRQLDSIIDAGMG